MNPMKTWLRDYFIFNNHEHKGSVILIFILLFFIALPQFIYFYKPYYPKNENIKLENVLNAYNKAESDIETIQLFEFNPNSVSREDFVKLGLKEKTIDIILNYRNKGGKFKSKDDFKKMYTLDEQTFLKLEPYLILDNQVNITYSDNNKTKENDTIHYKSFQFNPNTISVDSMKLLGLLNAEINHLVNLRNKGAKFYNKSNFNISSWRQNKLLEIRPLLIFEQVQQSKIINPNEDKPNNVLPSLKSNVGIIDINKADEALLRNLNGIGDVYAKKIIKNREQLGGYYQLSQLSFVIPDTLLIKIKPYLEVKPNSQKRIKINKIDQNSLASHPLFKYKAEMIINYRNNHGSFKSIQDIWKIQSIKKDFIDKVEPYLDFEE